MSERMTSERIASLLDLCTSYPSGSEESMAPVRIGEAVSVLDEVLELRGERDALRGERDDYEGGLDQIRAICIAAGILGETTSHTGTTTRWSTVRLVDWLACRAAAVGEALDDVARRLCERGWGHERDGAAPYLHDHEIAGRVDDVLVALHRCEEERDDLRRAAMEARVGVAGMVARLATLDEQAIAAHDALTKAGAPSTFMGATMSAAERVRALAYERDTHRAFERHVDRALDAAGVDCGPEYDPLATTERLDALVAQRDALRAEVERLRAAVIDIGAERNRLRALLSGEDAPEAVRTAWATHDPYDGFSVVYDPLAAWDRLVSYTHDDARLEGGYHEDTEQTALYRLVPVAWLTMRTTTDEDGEVLADVRDVCHPDAALAGLEVSDG